MSPCTKNCSLNTSTNICEGCGRTLDEIIEWTRMTDEEKQQVMKRLSETQIISSNCGFIVCDEEIYMSFVLFSTDTKSLFS